MPRLAFLKSRWNHRGGAEKYSAQLAQAFANRGCDVTVLTSGDIHPPADASYKALSLQPDYKWNLRQLTAFDRHCQQWLLDNPQDIVFGMDRNRQQTHYRAGNGVHAAYLERRSQLQGPLSRFLLTVNPFHRKVLEIERQGFESDQLTHLFANSHMVRKEIERFYPKAASKVSVVHNGVEWQEIGTVFAEWSTSRERLLLEHGLDPDQLQLLFIGQGFRRKGLPLVLEALKRYAGAVQLTVVGKDPELETFRSWAAKEGLEKAVQFTGPQSPVWHFYQIADAVALPSVYDPFANVTVEALAMGCYFITSKGNGGSEVVSENNGYVLDALSVSDMESAIEVALGRRKTVESAQLIRDSVAHLDFGRQLDRIVEATLA